MKTPETIRRPAGRHELVDARRVSVAKPDVRCRKACRATGERAPLIEEHFRATVSAVSPAPEHGVVLICRARS